MVKKNDDVILAEMLGMFRTRQYVPSSWQIAASDGTGVTGGGAPDTFTPADLFANGEDGAWYDPSDLSTLWKDTAGTDPVTADGDVVRRVDDKSGNGYNLTNATSSKSPAYRTSGGLHWLQFDGNDDHLDVSSLSGKVAASASLELTSAQDGYRAVFKSDESTVADGVMLLANLGTDEVWGTFGGGSNQASNTDLSDLQARVITMEGASSGTFYTDGSSDGTYSATQGDTAGSVGADTTPSINQPTAMKLFSLIIRDSVFGSDLSDLVTWQGNKAGLSL